MDKCSFFNFGYTNCDPNDDADKKQNFNWLN